MDSRKGGRSGYRAALEQIAHTIIDNDGLESAMVRHLAPQNASLTPPGAPYQTCSNFAGGSDYTHVSEVFYRGGLASSHHGAHRTIPGKVQRYITLTFTPTLRLEKETRLGTLTFEA